MNITKNNLECYSEFKLKEVNNVANIIISGSMLLEIHKTHSTLLLVLYEVIR